MFNTDYYLTKFKIFPLSKLYFITVRDPSQSSRWMLLEKVREWIRRYSNSWVIVGGRAGGVHYHLIAHIKDRSLVKFPKGIHIHIKPLVDRPEPPSAEELEDIRKAQYFGEIKQNRIKRMLFTQHEIKFGITQILSKMILKHFCRLSNKEKKAKVIDKKDYHISGILDYLDKNLDEIPDPVEYLDYREWFG